MRKIQKYLQKISLKPYRMQLIDSINENTKAINEMHRKIFMDNPVMIIRNAKIFLPLHYVDHIQRIIYQSKDYYEYETLDFLKLHYKSFSFILDIGSNIGNHALFFASQLGAQRIECFEPNKTTFSTLKKNIEINSFKKIIKLHNNALGSSVYTGIEKGYNVFNTGENHILREESTDEEAIHVLPLDQFNFQKVDLIKIDVEGFELEVLQGAKETIAQSKPIILVEVFENNLPEIEMILESYGYKKFFRPEKDNYLFVSK